MGFAHSAFAEDGSAVHQNQQRRYTLTHTNDELTELTEQMVRLLVPGRAAIVTKGVFSLEILFDDDGHRTVIGALVGRQGFVAPWEAVGLMTPSIIQAVQEMPGFFKDGAE